MEPENIPQYGQPANCRGWRQFLVERACAEADPEFDEASYESCVQQNLLPHIIWVSENPYYNIDLCSHVRYILYMPSAKIGRAALGLELYSGLYSVCKAQGRFIE